MADGLQNSDAVPLAAADIQRLRAMAAGRGHLTLEDLQRALPVEDLSPEAIARAVLQLEDAGIEIEVDPALARPRHAPAPLVAGTPALALPEETDSVRARATRPIHVGPDSWATPAAGPADRPMESRVSSRRATVMVIGIVVLVCAVLGWLASRFL